MVMADLPGDLDLSLVQRAEALGPLLAEHAERTEAERQVVPEVMTALESAGLFEVMVPKRVGGLGATMATQLAVAAELGRTCASSAWIQTLINVTTWAATKSRIAGELFGSDDRPRVCGVLAPSGTATPDADGYRVSGRWGFASGSFHASWFIGGVVMLDDSGELADVGMALIPRSDFTIDDTWYVAGMSGTASNTVVAEDILVPAERVTSLSEEPVVPDPCDPADRWPLGSVLSLVLMGPLLGAASAAADLVTEKAPARAISYTSYATTPESTVAITALARSRLDIDTAWLHVFQAAAYIDSVGEGASRDLGREARLRGQCGYATELLRRAMDSLLDVAGAGSFASASALQRMWRDLNVGSRHAFLATNVSLETYGRSLFGLDPVLVIV
jgi:alkylation response protein AidB-like acyl-CoA dehydrogenase